MDDVRSASLTSIAATAGVSVSTVSKVLNGPAGRDLVGAAAHHGPPAAGGHGRQRVLDTDQAR